MCIVFVPLRQGHLIWTPLVKLHDYVTKTTHSNQVINPHSIFSFLRYVLPLDKLSEFGKFFLQHRIFLATLHEEWEPIHYFEVVRDVWWRDAMTSEINILQSNGTWDITPLSIRKKPLGCKWIYKIKYHSNGRVERFIAQLVVLGNHQVKGIECDENFALVTKMVIIRIVLAIVVAKDWEHHQMDVHNAFLHGDMEEVVYMKLPLEFLMSQDGMVCRLCKSIYGLR